MHAKRGVQEGGGGGRGGGGGLTSGTGTELDPTGTATCESAGRVQGGGGFTTDTNPAP